MKYQRWKVFAKVKVLHFAKAPHEAGGRGSVLTKLSGWWVAYESSFDFFGEENHRRSKPQWSFQKILWDSNLPLLCSSLTQSWEERSWLVFFDQGGHCFNRTPFLERGMRPQNMGRFRVAKCHMFLLASPSAKEAFPDFGTKGSRAFVGRT